ncbi:MAG: membrane protein insertion efficiency factor YidD [candidate division KSB1 bacterium]|nr:membrane protein insertion efficiency factor YidD [candidate division KSB1 bacterium]
MSRKWRGSYVIGHRLGKDALRAAIVLYRSTLGYALPPACRFEPTCSEYALQAVERFGAWRGLVLSLWRVLRCNPWNRGGFDPVPERFQLGRLGRTDGP